eukprot:752807-Hanusia_phi.AAC.5
MAGTVNRSLDLDGWDLSEDHDHETRAWQDTDGDVEMSQEDRNTRIFPQQEEASLQVGILKEENRKLYFELVQKAERSVIERERESPHAFEQQDHQEQHEQLEQLSHQGQLEQLEQSEVISLCLSGDGCSSSAAAAPD